MNRPLRKNSRHRAEAEAETRACDHPGCDHHGEYRAPKSREALETYYWFCLDHVRAYNAAWDYYKGMNTEQIEAMLRRDVTWQRPTWPLGSRVSGRYRIDPAHLRDPFGFFTGGDAHPLGARVRVETAEDAALRVMALTRPLTLVALKARYKELVKRHHPDANGGDKASEERFKEINQAYKTLTGSLNP